MMEIAYNYRLPNINAALGCGQMERLSAMVEAKAGSSRNPVIWKVFKDLPNVSIFREAGGGTEQLLKARTRRW